MFKKSLIAVIMSALLLTTATTAFADTDAEADGASKTSSTVTSTVTSSRTNTKTETFDSPIPDYFGDDTYDTKGNLSLIKQEKIIYDSEEMQFIAVTTKDGHVFYILIDYTAIKAAENGEEGADARETVYFLNKVDDYDLFTLLYNDSDSDNPYSNYTMEGGFSENTDTDTQDSQPDDSDEENGSSGFPTWAVMLVFIALVAGGYWFFKIRPGKKAPVYDDDDELDYGDDYEADIAKNEPESNDE